MIHIGKQRLQWLDAQQNVHISNIHPKERISLCQISKPQLSSESKVFQQRFSYRNHKFARIKTFHVKTLMTLMKIRLAFKLHWLPAMPTGYQEFKGRDKLKTLPGILLHLLQQTHCQVIGTSCFLEVSLGCTAPGYKSSEKNTLYSEMPNGETHNFAQYVVLLSL